MRLLSRTALLGTLCAVLLGGAPALGSAAAADDPAWLARVNAVRVANGLPPAAAEPAWNAGIAAHLRYLRLTPASLRTGEYANAHTENPQSPYYTPEGDQAGRSSNLGSASSDVAAVDQWLAAPFHAIGMLRPGLARVGFHRDPETGQTGQDVIRGLTPLPTTTPVFFPGPGTTTELVRFVAESPNPLEPCGYSRAGLPLIALLPQAPTADLRAELTGPDGTTVSGHSPALCVITADSWRSSDGVYGPSGQAILRADNAVFVIPPTALQDGGYTVRLVQGGQPDVTWSFSASLAGTAFTGTFRRSDCGVAQLTSLSDLPVLIDVRDDHGAATAAQARVLEATVGGQLLRSSYTASYGSAYGINATLYALGAPRALPVSAESVQLRLLDGSGTELARQVVPLAGCPSVPTALALDALVTPARTDGLAALVTGVLRQTASGTPLPRRPVEVDTRPTGSLDWRQTASASTDAVGRVSVRVPNGTEYRLRAVATPAGDASTSETGRVEGVATTASPTPSPTVSPAPEAPVSPGPTPAPARTAPQLQLSSGAVSFGTPVDVRVTGTPGGTVDLYSRLYPNSAFTRIRAGVPLDASGSAVITTRPNHNLRLLARDPDGAGDSGQPLVQVAKKASLQVARVATRTYTFSGSALPAHRGQVLNLYRNGVLLRQGLPTDAQGRWSSTVRLPAGPATYEVRSPSTGYNLAAAASRRLAAS